MKRISILVLVFLLLTAIGCSNTPQPATVLEQEPGIVSRGALAPAGDDDRPTKQGPVRLEWAETHKYEADGPYPVRLTDIPDGVYDAHSKLATGRLAASRLPAPLPEEEMARLRQLAMSAPPNERVQEMQPGPVTKAINPGVAFDSLDYNDCCGGAGNVPPDPEIAAGPNHIIVVVNVAFEIYDKVGTLLQGPTTFASFFAGTPGCSNTGVFDPNVLYDEKEDRFILAIDGNGTDYCIAATTGADPLGTWNRFAFATDIGGAFFDFPHAGVGNEAIYMGSNQFGQTSFLEARVFAIEKAALYNGGTPQVVTHSTGNDGTPQPANLHGWNQGTWPNAGTAHYIMTEIFDGANHTVWSWQDPFGADTLTRVGDVNLNTATGITAQMPIDWPQPGTSRNLQGNDWRGQGTEYRNGFLFIANNQACNPGSGTVNCVRWAKIDPTGPSAVEAGVFGSDGIHRTFPGVSANACEDMAIGYSRGGSSDFAGVWMAGREAGDPAGTLQPEFEVKAGEITYASFEQTGAYRWGDYTRMTVDPDGETFWYIGEYVKDTGTTQGRWGNYVGSFKFDGCQASNAVCGDGVVEGAEVCDGADLGGQSCSSQGCSGGGTLVCNATCDGYDTASCLDCPVCDNDGICEAGEDCNNCSLDCPGGSTSGAVCGNGICEAGDGEDCLSCAADCNGRQSGKPSNRYCCGDGAGQNPVACNDSRCSASGNTCTDIPSIPGSFCCGDFTCDSGESCATCALDCSAGFELCNNGIDDDCNGAVDCADTACLADPVCQGGSCSNAGESCSVNGDCCSNKCKGPSSNRTCR